MISPIAWRTPPRHYGPWEAIVSLLTEQLVQLGVDVTLFATGDSITRARLAATCPRPWSEDPSVDAKVAECLHISAVFERAGEFDLIHNHFDFLPLSYSRLVATPVVTTIHGFSSPAILPVYRKYNDSNHYVSISEADRAAELDYLATIHHGIDIGQFGFHPDAGEYLLFFGRIHPEKGVHEAIQVARKLDIRLKIAGIIQDRHYFDVRVRPYIDGTQVEYVGAVGPEQRQDMLGGALALLHLISFDEPFGLSLVESLACGTPVIAIGRGSIPEIVRHGETGYIVRNTDEAADAVALLSAIDRAACREDAERRFSHTRMARQYLDAYEQILEHKVHA